jgi:hypothetical protein
MTRPDSAGRACRLLAYGVARGRALVGRDNLLVDEVDADFFVDVYGPGVGREKMVTERLDNILHS